MIEYSNIDTIDQEAIVRQIETRKEFSCTLPYSNPQSEQYLSAALSTLLVTIGKTELFTYLEYCLKEMVMNASKANSKRIYFREKRLKITDPADYSRGIANFKVDVFGNFDTFASKHRELSSIIKVQFKLTEDSLVISVLNNSTLCPEEKLRIDERMKMADKFNTMAEVLMHGFDETEGAGFGLIIVVLMLRKMNLDERVFLIKDNSKYTISTLTIPLQLISEEHGQLLAREISEEIDKMPQFPEGVLRLQKELGNPNCDFHSLAEIIKQDSAMATEIIRVANSPLYRLPQSVEDVSKAVKMIGVQGVRNLMLSFGVAKVFEQRYNKEKIAEVMEHSYIVATLSSQIAKIKKLQSLKEDIYVAALLHDLGKIVVNALQPRIADKLRKICQVKHIPINALEDLTDGYNHSLIGALLAEKWNFPPRLTECIKFHHIPLEASAEHTAIINILYLANELFYYYNGQRSFEELNYKVLKFLGFEQPARFAEMTEQVKSGL